MAEEPESPPVSTEPLLCADAERLIDPRGLLLTGGVGVGKTTIAVEVGVVLGEQRIEHAVIDLDWLSWGATSFDGRTYHRRRLLLVQNLQAVWRNYKRYGVRRVVLAGSVITPAHLEGVRQALDGMPLRVVRVRAPLELTARRLQLRDPASQTVGSVGDLQAFEQRVVAAGLESQVVENIASDPSQLARQVVADWLSDPGGRRPTAAA